jgi:hypothetical protein
MKTRPGRDPQETAKYVCNIPSVNVVEATLVKQADLLVM